MKLPRSLLHAVGALVICPSVAMGFSDDFETDQQWGIFEEIVHGSVCYGDGIGEVARSTDVAFNGSHSLRVWANKAGSLSSNHVIAQKRLSFAGRTGIWRYEMRAYIAPESEGRGQTGPEFSMQNTRELEPGVFRTATAGMQYQANPFSGEGNWAIWTEQTAGVADWQLFTFQRLEPGQWYSIIYEVDYTRNRYRWFSVKGLGVDVHIDVSAFRIALEDKFSEEAFWISVEGENLYNNCGEAGVFDYRVYYDEIRLVGADIDCHPQPADLADIGTLADWVKGIQYTDITFPSYGAIKNHHSVGHRDPESVPYYRVVPYNANLGLLGLLRAPVAGKLAVAEKWIDWYLSHLNMGATPPGIVYDHWYQTDGSGESTCPPGIPAEFCDHDDSSDSPAATFLGAAWAYYEEGGSKEFLTAAGNKEKFETIAGVILALQQDDGLTWAKDPYRVKYVMDNSEVYWGLRSMANLETYVFGDPTAAAVYDAAADRVRDGILGSLVDPATSLYRVAKFENDTFQAADLDVWYPGAVAQVWPHLFGVTGSSSDTAQASLAALNDSWDGTPNPDWTSNVVSPQGFLWPSIGLAALLAGDSERARAQASFIKEQKFPAFEYPWTVDDAGFLMRTLSICPTGSVAGLVTTFCSGATVPAENVSVALRLAATEIASTTTAIDGTFLFDHLPLGSYTVVLTPPPGYSTDVTDQVVSLVREGEQATADFVLVCDTPPGTWFVNGSLGPGPGDGSRANPWRTIREAIEARDGNVLRVKEGDVVLVEPGVYEEQLFFYGGVPRPDGNPDWHPKAPNNYVSFRSRVAGQAVVIDGGNLTKFPNPGVCGDPADPAQWLGITFNLGIKGITLEDFEIRNWSRTGVVVAMAEDITLSGVDIHDNGEGVRIDNYADAHGKNVRILDSEIHDNGGPLSRCSGISMGGVGHELARNRIHHNGLRPGGGNRGILLHLSASDRVATGIEIHHNWIYRNGFGVMIGGDPAVQGNRLHHNIVCSNEINGVQIQEQSGGNIIEDNLIFNNGGADLRYDRVRDPWPGLVPNVIRNNTVRARPEQALPLSVLYWPNQETFDWLVFDGNSYSPADGRVLWQDASNVSPPQYLTFADWRAKGQDPTSTLSDGPTLSCPPFLVTTIDDSGPGSLRQALIDAEANPGLDAIVFAVPGVGDHTIAVASALPAIEDPVILDGTTQRGFEGVPVIHIDGSAAAPSGPELAVHGLEVLAGSTTLRGLMITGFSGDGVHVEPLASQQPCASCVPTGVDISGSEISFNGGAGVAFLAGTNGLLSNTVSGNRFQANAIGVQLAGSDPTTVTRNIVARNQVGIVTASGGHSIFHNLLIGNGEESQDAGGNTWVDPGSNLGNFWGNYWGEDDGSGGRVAGDYVGDTQLPHEGVDVAPLMDPSIPEMFGSLLYADWWLYWRGAWGPVEIELVDPGGRVVSESSNEVGDNAFYVGEDELVPGTKLVKILVHRPGRETGALGPYAFQMTALEDQEYSTTILASERGTVVFEHSVQGGQLQAGETQCGLEARLSESVDPETRRVRLAVEPIAAGKSASLAGQVTAECPAPGTGLAGVTVDAFSNLTGLIAGSTHTDDSGHFQLDHLGKGQYTLTLVKPLGYTIPSEEMPFTLAGCESKSVSMSLGCVEITPQARSMGFWKHQVGVALGDKGSAQVDAMTLCSYLDMIEVHFNSNRLNEVRVYEPLVCEPGQSPEDCCTSKLHVAKELLNLKGSVGMKARAKQQFMALLLNVAAEKLGLTNVVSEDGATVSQAITFCDLLIDDAAGDHELAKNIADDINNGRVVGPGVIPLDTRQIAYGRGGAPEPLRFELRRIHPNPFRAPAIISFVLPRTLEYKLSIFDVAGRVIRRVAGSGGPGDVSWTWDGRGDGGRGVRPGIYFCRVSAGEFRATRALVLLE